MTVGSGTVGRASRRAFEWKGAYALVILCALVGMSCVGFGPFAAGGRAPCHDRQRRLVRTEGAVEARPVASLLGSFDDEEPEEPLEDEGEPAEGGFAAVAFPPGLGVRFGLTAYPVTADFDMDPRYRGGTLYYHFGEKETSRIEGCASLLADSADTTENFCMSFGADYVKFLGKEGFMYWAAGGGAILETLYDDSYTLGYLRGAVGYWLGSGERGADLRAGMELPVGTDLNAVLAVFVTVGFDL